MADPLRDDSYFHFVIHIYHYSADNFVEDNLFLFRVGGDMTEPVPICMSSSLQTAETSL